MVKTFDTGEFTLERLRENVWELPQEGEMRVPGRVLASEALLEEISQDLTLTQLRNTTELPGIQKYAICMPDGHQGYGFPVGGVAGLDAEDGCISPGAVGYDINCLTGDASVSLSFGRRLPLAALRDRFESDAAVVAADGGTTSPIRLFTESGEQRVYEVTTETGRTVRATADHQFRTPDGMVALADLEPGDAIHVRPFEGIAHERPAEFVVIDGSDLQLCEPDEGASSTEAELLPLRSTDEAFNRLLKLVGFHTGRGAFEGSETWFYAAPSDLERIRADIAALGFQPGPIEAGDPPGTPAGDEPPERVAGLRVPQAGFKRLLVALGAPDGPTVESGFTTPGYLDRLTDWQRGLYLSAYFGAAMTAPAAGAETRLAGPTVGQIRTCEHAAAGEQFMQELAAALASLGIDTTPVARHEVPTGGDLERIELALNDDAATLRRFFSRVGYRYDRAKQRRAVKAIQYLRTVERSAGRRAALTEGSTVVADGGTPPPGEFRDADVRRTPSGQARPAGKRGFADFCETLEVADDLTVPARVAAVEDAGRAPVYDIGVEHGAHNFVANGFVVSNCGVRMVKTSLTYDDLKGTEEALTNALFDAIPSGLGGGGVVEGDMDTIESILARGMDWALEQGYAIEDDLRHCEDEGRRPDTDPAAVSQKAKDRGRNQVGSLGSGNHFLEIQRVTDVFLDDVAEAYGLEVDQVVVLIHCGSRGLGHQVCTDYLRDIERTHQGLLRQLPDKELAAAPAGSQLAEEYYGAMCAAINFAWVNRQLVMHRTRTVFEDVFDRSWEEMGMYLLYDVAHNIAKREVHDVDGADRELFVHRKGATRAFPAGHTEVPRAYRDVGQPIIIPGSMGSGSYVLRGGAASMTETFGSTAHGAGRLMSRTQAKNTYWGEDVRDDLREQNQIYVQAQSGATIAEEAPGVYKDVDEVVRVSDALGIGDKVARVYPVCNIKG